MGVASSPTGRGVVGEGHTGIEGLTLVAGGIGVSGSTYAVAGAASIAGLFNNSGGGAILVGKASGINQFRVDSSGRVFANNGYQAGGADFAESFEPAGEKADYTLGDVLVIDPTAQRRVTLTNEPYSTLVAGIYSTKPGVLATPHAIDDPQLAKELPVAMLGIVLCKVSVENGAIAIGDLLVTSSTPGYAMKGTDRYRMVGAMIGKALQPLRGTTGIIQVLVTLH